MELQLLDKEVRQARFPMVCARTGEDCEERQEVMLRYPGWRVLLSVVMPIPFLLVYVTWHKSARCTIALPLSEEEFNKHYIHTVAQFVVLLLGSLNTLLVGLILPNFLPNTYSNYYWWVLAMSLLLTIIIVETIRRTHIWIRKIGKDSVTLAGLHPRFVEEYLEERNE